MARSYYGLDKVTGYSPNIDFRSIRQEVNTELERISKEREGSIGSKKVGLT